MVLLLAAFVLVMLGLGKPMSLLFWGGLLALVGLVLGCVVLGRVGLVLRRASLALVGLGAVNALVASGDDSRSFLQVLRLPSREPLPRWTSLVPERDAALLSLPFLASEEERHGLDQALDTIYDELEADAPFRRTTQLTTMLGLQTRVGSDAFAHRGDDETSWVVFLHGAGGNVAANCWVIAHAAAAVGWSSVCPSTTMSGRWDRGDGPSIVDSALRHARREGARRIVIVGYSNGALGALSLLAARPPPDIVGLVLISGFDPTFEARRITMPVLVVSGERDERFPARALRSWTRPEQWKVEVIQDADHMLIVKQRELLSRYLEAFLANPSLHRPIDESHTTGSR